MHTSFKQFFSGDTPKTLSWAMVPPDAMTVDGTQTLAVLAQRTIIPEGLAPSAHKQLHFVRPIVDRMA